MTGEDGGLRVRTALFTALADPTTHTGTIPTLEEGLASRADVVISDLEDTVPDAMKSAARTFLTAQQPDRTGRLWVRINDANHPDFQKDIEAASRVANAIVIPKVEKSRDIEAVTSLLDDSNAAPQVIAIIETAAGLTRLDEICRARSSRFTRLILGLADLSRDMRLEWDPFGHFAVYARCKVAEASAAYALARPIDSVAPTFDDFAQIGKEARLAQSLGFEGKCCLSIPQVESVQQALMPTESELEQAERIVKAFDRAESDGVGTLIVDGKFVDLPIAERARQLLRDAGSERRPLVARDP